MPSTSFLNTLDNRAAWVLGSATIENVKYSDRLLCFPNNVPDFVDPMTPNWVSVYASGFNSLAQCPLENLINIGDTWFPQSRSVQPAVYTGWIISKRDKQDVIHGWNWDELELGDGVGYYYPCFNIDYLLTLPPNEKRAWFPFKMLRAWALSSHSKSWTQQWSGIGRRTVADGTFRMKEGADAKIAKRIQSIVKDGLLEFVETMFLHWQVHAEMGDRYSPERIRDEQERTRLTLINNNDANTAKGNVEAIRIEHLRLQDDLKSVFANATTIKQTLRAASRYFAGEFGVDWSARGYWHHTRSPWHRRKADERMDGLQKLHSLHRVGFVEHPFRIDSLKPFFKRFPTLARIYGITDDNPENIYPPDARPVVYDPVPNKPTD